MGTDTPPLGFRGIFRTDDEARAVYSEAAGIEQLMPAAVAVPVDSADVVVLVQWAHEHRVPLTPRGAGSSMAGGALGAGVIVDLARLAEMGHVDRASRRISVGPAVTRADIERAANADGLTFPVDPSSSEFASIGGMCATNAAGARTVKYGAMRQWIHGLDCVFSNGARAWVRRGEPAPQTTPVERFTYDVAASVRALPVTALKQAGVRKQSSGYGLAEWRESGDLLDLIIGSEGTLAVIVGIELKLAPRPASTAGLLAGFPDLEGAAAAAVRLAAAGASAVELLDRSFLEIATSTGDPLPIELPAGLEAVLIVEVEGDDEASTAEAVRALSGWCDAGGASFLHLAQDKVAAHKLWKLRHAASPILNTLAPRLQSMQIVEDGCVPPARFAEYVRGVRHALSAAGLRGVIFGHAGDAHAHVNALVDMQDPTWRERIERLLRDVTALVASLGGTLAGEHGDGRLRAPLLSRVWGAPALKAFAATKQAFDPKGILNPGVKVAPAGTAPLHSVKYDPTLPALPPAAREALDTVVREKAWGWQRLDLIETPSSE